MKRLIRLITLLSLVIFLAGCQTSAVTDVLPRISTVSESTVSYDKRSLIIYNDYSLSLKNLALMISNKIVSDTYNIGSTDKLDLASYDLILIGDQALNNQITSAMQIFLRDLDFQDKEVGLFWIDGSDDESVEAAFASLVNNGQLLPGLGFDNSEISKGELVSQFVDGWLTTIYQ